MQDKVWMHGPGKEPWEVYPVKDDSQTYGSDSAAPATPATCCTPGTGAVAKPEGCCG